MLEGTPQGQKFIDQLPDYMNGLLPKDDQQWMEQFTRDNQQAKYVLQFERRLSAVIHGAVSPIPLEDSLKDFLSRAEKEGLLRPLGHIKQGELAKVRSAPAVLPPLWWSRLWRPMSILGPVLAMLVVAFVAPTLWIAQRGEVHGSDESGTSYRGTANSVNTPCAQQFRLRVVFAKQARLEEVSLLFGKLEADIVAGPTVNGEYWVRLPSSSALQKAIATLKEKKWVDDVWIPPTDSTLGCR